jgi:hypothetical protein
MEALYIMLVLLALAWPLVAAGAAVLVILGLVRLARGQILRRTWPTSSRCGWLLSAGTALAAIASYGYGLARTTSLSMADAEDRCAIASPDTYGYDHPLSPTRVQSLWPLQDTSCGPDLVPAFVNPLAVALAVLCLTLVAVTVAAKVRRAGDAPEHLSADH